jgi:hypothetical protein
MRQMTPRRDGIARIGLLAPVTALVLAAGPAAAFAPASEMVRKADLGGMVLGAALIAAGLGARWLMRRLSE